MRRGIIAAIIVIVAVVIITCLFHASMRNSDATIDRIDKKIERSLK